MSVTVELPAATLARLHAEAARRGISIDDLIAELADQLPADTTPDTTPNIASDVSPTALPRTLAFVAAGASTAGITPRLDELLADGFGRN